MPGTYGFMTRWNGDLVRSISSSTSRSVGADEVNMLECWGFTLTSSAVAANRVMNIECRDSLGNVVWFTANPVAQTASLVYDYSFCIGAEQSTAAWTPGGGSGLNPRVVIPVPKSFAPPGGSYVEVTTNLDGGDSFAIMTSEIRRWRV